MALILTPAISPHPHPRPIPSLSPNPTRDTPHECRTGAPSDLRVLHNHRLQPLRLPILHIHRLHITIQLLLGAFLVVSLPADPHPQTIRHPLDPGLPDALVELRVQTHVRRAHGCDGEAADLFYGAGSALFEGGAEDLIEWKELVLPVF